MKDMRNVDESVSVKKKNEYNFIRKILFICI